jgi:hypothetical protein
MSHVDVEEILEADYASEPTLLYLLIEERDWEGVKYQAENFETEVRTWIRKVDLDTNTIRWRVLPIHAALLNGVPAYVLVRFSAGCEVSFSQFAYLHLLCSRHSSMHTRML